MGTEKQSLKGSFLMTKSPAELMREFVRSQNFTSTDDIMTAMKDMFRDVLQQVMECELADELGLRYCYECLLILLYLYFFLIIADYLCVISF